MFLSISLKILIKIYKFTKVLISSIDVHCKFIVVSDNFVSITIFRLIIYLKSILFITASFPRVQ